jgi:hypothetical protein
MVTVTVTVTVTVMTMKTARLAIQRNKRPGELHAG